MRWSSARTNSALACWYLYTSLRIYGVRASTATEPLRSASSSKSRNLIFWSNSSRSFSTFRRKVVNDSLPVAVCPENCRFTLESGADGLDCNSPDEEFRLTPRDDIFRFNQPCWPCGL